MGLTPSVPLIHSQVLQLGHWACDCGIGVAGCRWQDGEKRHQVTHSGG